VDLGDQGPHLDSVLGAGADLEVGEGRDDALPQGVRGVLSDGDDDRDRHAPLAGGAVWWTYSAIGVEPTKLTASTSSCARRASTAVLSPCTTLNTPLGNPASEGRAVDG
jgi:hypothetical protein